MAPRAAPRLTVCPVCSTMEDDAGPTGRAEPDILRLPPSPITSDQPGAAVQRHNTSAASRKRGDTTHLPTVLQDMASLEHERQRLTAELLSLKDAQVAVAARLKAAEEARHAQLENLGRYDKFFLTNKGSHPLGRRYAVQQTAATIAKQLQKLDNQRVKLLAKLNQSCDANNEVRTRIDLLRREACVFRELFAKMEVRPCLPPLRSRLCVVRCCPCPTAHG